MSHNFSQRLDLRKPNEHVALQNFFIYYTWENIRKQHKNNRLKRIVSIRNDEFELADGSYSMSDIRDHIENIIKKHYETLIH